MKGDRSLHFTVLFVILSSTVGKEGCKCVCCVLRRIWYRCLGQNFTL